MPDGSACGRVCPAGLSHLGPLCAGPAPAGQPHDTRAGVLSAAWALQPDLHTRPPVIVNSSVDFQSEHSSPSPPPSPGDGRAGSEPSEPPRCPPGPSPGSLGGLVRAALGVKLSGPRSLNGAVWGPLHGPSGAGAPQGHCCRGSQSPWIRLSRLLSRHSGGGRAGGGVGRRPPVPTKARPEPSGPGRAVSHFPPPPTTVQPCRAPGRAVRAGASCAATLELEEEGSRASLARAKALGAHERVVSKEHVEADMDGAEQLRGERLELRVEMQAGWATSWQAGVVGGCWDGTLILPGHSWSTSSVM